MLLFSIYCIIAIICAIILLCLIKVKSTYEMDSQDVILVISISVFWPLFAVILIVTAICLSIDSVINKCINLYGKKK